MAPTTRSQSNQPQNDEDEGQQANAAGPSTGELEAAIQFVNEDSSYQPEGHLSNQPNTNNDGSSDSEPAPPLKLKSGKKPKMGKKGQAHDTSYKPSKESDQSDDTDLSQDWNESPLDQPTWNIHAFETPQPKSAKKASTKKQPKGHDSTYKPTFKLSDDDDDDDWEDLYPPGKKVKWQKSNQTPSGKYEFHQPKKPNQALPVTPVAKTIGTMAKAGHSSWPVTLQSKTHQPAPGIPPPEIPVIEVDDAEMPWTHVHKSLMPTIPGFNTIFQEASEAGPPAAPRPSNGNTPKSLPQGVFKGPPRPLQLPKPKEEEATNDNNSDDDQIPWMKGRNRKRKMPEIPGFVDIFAIDKPPSTTVKPYSYFLNIKPSKTKFPKPVVPKPEVPKPEIPKQTSNTEIPKPTPKQTEPQTETFPKEKPSQLLDAVELEPGLLKDRDWPPYPGTIYCKRCFYHDCFRTIKLRRHILHILKLLEDGEAFLHFVIEVLLNAAVKSPPLPEAFGKNYFHQQIPGDVTALNILEQVIRHVKRKVGIKTSPETQEKVNKSLEEICSLLNLSDTQYRRILIDWFESRKDLQAKLQGAGYSIPKVEPDALRAIRQQIILALNPLLGYDVGFTPDPNDDQWFKTWQEHLEVLDISTALKAIDNKNYHAKLSPFKLPIPTKLNCSYCVHSGADNKAKAHRPYPRDMAADARIPWAESLHGQYPGRYDKNGNEIKYEIKGIFYGGEKNKTITNAEEFLDSLRAEGAQEASYGGFTFLVWKNGEGNSSSDVRFVLVKMWSVVEAIESLDFVPVLHALKPQETE